VGRTVLKRGSYLEARAALRSSGPPERPPESVDRAGYAAIGLAKAERALGNLPAAERRGAGGAGLVRAGRPRRPGGGPVLVGRVQMDVAERALAAGDLGRAGALFGEAKTRGANDQVAVRGVRLGPRGTRPREDREAGELGRESRDLFRGSGHPKAGEVDDWCERIAAGGRRVRTVTPPGRTRAARRTAGRSGRRSEREDHHGT
jgi:hypothetical protein